MNQQQSRTLQQVYTTLAPADVLAEAVRFFTRHNSIYAAFLEQRGPTYVSFRGQGGEELLVGVAPVDGGSAVNGSTYMFDQQVARFLETLPHMAAPVAPAPPVVDAAAITGAAA